VACQRLQAVRVAIGGSKASGRLAFLRCVCAAAPAQHVRVAVYREWGGGMEQARSRRQVRTAFALLTSAPSLASASRQSTWPLVAAKCRGGCLTCECGTRSSRSLSKTQAPCVSKPTRLITTRCVHIRTKLRQRLDARHLVVVGSSVNGGVALLNPRHVMGCRVRERRIGTQPPREHVRCSFVPSQHAASRVL